MNKRFVSGILVAVLLAAASSRARSLIQRPEAQVAALRLAPLAQDRPATAAMAIQKRQLSNGLRVWIVEQHELPVVQMSLLVLAGTGADPRGRYGVASLTASMLTEGAGSRSAVEIADALDALLANLSGSSDVDSSSLQLYVPLDRLGEALAIMADVAQRPAFGKPELETLRQQRLATLRNARGNPDAIGALAFARASYGPSHRSAAPLVGTADNITALTPEALHAFHQSAYRPANSTLIVVGDVTPDRLLPLLEAHFGQWQPGSPTAAASEPAPAVPAPARQLMLVDMPGAPQSRILAGAVGGPNSMADFFPMQVLNTVVRGRLSPDRNQTLRDYTAGVRSGFDLRRSATPFVVAAAAQADRTGESLRALVDELNSVVKGIPADELARAKEDLARDFPKTFDAPGRISSRLRALQSLVVYGLPDDYYANYASAIQAVAAADVQRVAQQYLHADRLTIVIVGDRKTIEPSLRALNLGSITEVSVDELFAPTR
jgi:predicted Zn-dependent peptidase